MHAYDETLLYKAQTTLARMFDYAVNDYGMPIKVFYELFLNSKFSRRFAAGDSRTIAGCSGTELAREIISDATGESDFPKAKTVPDRTSEYWLGYNIAYYQWKKGISFEAITRSIGIDYILSMYSKYHEMDILQFIDHIDELRQKNMDTMQLKRLRSYARLSQSQLAKASGVPLRTIQQYEQGQKDISKAAFETVLALSKVLKCDPEKLIG